LADQHVDGLLAAIIDVETEPAQKLPHCCPATAELAGGQHGFPRQEAMCNADDRFRVVAFAVVHQDILTGPVEVISMQELFLSEPVVLRDRREHRFSGDVVERPWHR